MECNVYDNFDIFDTLDKYANNEKLNKLEFAYRNRNNYFLAAKSNLRRVGDEIQRVPGI